MAKTWAENTLRKALAPRQVLTLPDWARRYYQLDKTSPGSGTFDVETHPWLAQPLLDFQDPEIADIFLALGLQLGKSTLGGLCLAWAIVEDPGPAAWYHSDEKQLRDFVRGRLFDSWGRSEIIAELMPAKHEGKTLEGVDFMSCQVAFLPILSEANRTGRPLRYVIGDELKDWPQGSWDQVKKRTAAWENLSKTLGFSTPKLEGDNVDRGLRSGSTHRWHVDCPHCNFPQAIVWKQFEWERFLDEQGGYDFPKITASARIICANKDCKKPMASAADQAQELAARMRMLKSGRWIQTNKSAPRGRRSYTAPSWINPQVSIGKLVTEYLEAKIAEKNGFMDPLRDFYQQRCAISWSDGATDTDTALENVLEVDEGQRGIRIITVDVQQDLTAWAACVEFVGSFSGEGAKRKFIPSGRSHLVDAGVYSTLDDVRAWQEELGVRAGNVFVDTGYERSEVLIVCALNGWQGLRGEDRDKLYPHSETTADGKVVTVGKITSKPTLADPLQGRRSDVRAKYGNLGKVKLRKFSNLHAKDILFSASQRATFTVPPVHAASDAPFARHLRAERKEKLSGGRFIYRQINTRPNHLLDCAAMAMAIGWSSGYLPMSLAPADPAQAPAGTVALGARQALAV